MRRSIALNGSARFFAIATGVFYCASASFADAPKTAATPAAAAIEVTGVDGKRATLDIAALG
jgi:hypothetical protein